MTCVEYTDEATESVRLGVYTAYTMVEGSPHIRPLCAADEDDGVSCLFADEESPSAPLSAVRLILDPEYVFVSERQAGGGQGLGNPHGEHGEACCAPRAARLNPDLAPSRALNHRACLPE
jgi:hypothetical protein